MKRVLFALLPALTAVGCITAPGVGDWPSRDRGSEKVRQALGPAMEPSFERHVRGDDWTPKPFGTFSSHNCGGEACWGVTFCCRPGGREDESRDLTADEGRRILTGVRADVLAAVEKTGVDVTWAPAAEVGEGPNPAGEFAIRYIRRIPDIDGKFAGEVSGEIVGKLIPCGGSGDPLSAVRVTLNEWPLR